MSETKERAVTAIVPPSHEANNFSLSGDALHVDFALTSPTGRPRLTYHDTAQTRSFSGSDIRIVEVPDLGSIVSVTLSILPDVGSTTFSLLIPTVFLSGIGVSSQVTTEALTTIHRTPFVAYFIGQREVFRVTRMSGTANLQLF